MSVIVEKAASPSVVNATVDTVEGAVAVACSVKVVSAVSGASAGRGEPSVSGRTVPLLLSMPLHILGESIDSTGRAPQLKASGIVIANQSQAIS